MSFFEQQRSRKQAEIDRRNGRATPRTEPKPVERVPLMAEILESPALIKELTKPVEKKKKKSKYNIGETKEEIIGNIIEEKPPFKDVKAALKEYITISQEQYYE